MEGLTFDEVKSLSRGKGVVIKNKKGYKYNALLLTPTEYVTENYARSSFHEDTYGKTWVVVAAI